MYIFCCAGLASCRHRPLSSNVRPRISTTVATPPLFEIQARAPRGKSVLVALRALLGHETSGQNPVLLYSVCGFDHGQSQRQPFHCAATKSGAATQQLQGFPRPPASRQLNGLSAAAWQLCTVQGLTLRSKGAPTAAHQARAAPWCILRLAGLVACRCRPLSSNVRPRKSNTVATSPLFRRPARARRGERVFVALK